MSGFLAVLFRAIYEKKLTEEEKTLLIAAAKTGENEIRVIDLNEIARWVKIGAKTFGDENPTEAAKYLFAFNALRQKGYIAHKAGWSYKLNSSGSRRARKPSREE